jgi:uncharacterized UPF0160 family protein
MERIIKTIETMEELEAFLVEEVLNCEDDFSFILVTHPGICHAHDVMCALAFPTIIRTRNPEVIEHLIDLGCEVWDVGDSKRIRNERANDHHHDGYKPSLETMFPAELLEQAKYSLELTMILCSVMDLDNGIGHRDYVSSMISSFNPVLNEVNSKEAYDQAFGRAVEFAEMVVRYPENFTAIQAREEVRNSGKSLATEIVTKLCNEQAGNDFLVMPRFAPWQEVVVGFNKTKGTAFKWVIFPDKEWRVQGVPSEAGKFDGTKVQIKETDEGYIFCHPNRHIGGYQTKEQAIKAVQSWV